MIEITYRGISFKVYPSLPGWGVDLGVKFFIAANQTDAIESGLREVDRLKSDEATMAISVWHFNDSIDHLMFYIYIAPAQSHAHSVFFNRADGDIYAGASNRLNTPAFALAEAKVLEIAALAAQGIVDPAWPARIREPILECLASVKGKFCSIISTEKEIESE